MRSNYLRGNAVMKLTKLRDAAPNSFRGPRRAGYAWFRKVQPDRRGPWLGMGGGRSTTVRRGPSTGPFPLGSGIVAIGIVPTVAYAPWVG